MYLIRSKPKPVKWLGIPDNGNGELFHEYSHNKLKEQNNRMVYENWVPSLDTSKIVANFNPCGQIVDEMDEARHPLYPLF